LLDEIGPNLAYRWFAGLGFDQSIQDHSKFSKNRHGRFRDSSVFRDLFESVVRQCVDVGLVQGERLSVDGTTIAADASSKTRVSREQLPEAAKVSRRFRLRRLWNVAEQTLMAATAQNIRRLIRFLATPAPAPA